jgi:hypothetical protein
MQTGALNLHERKTQMARTTFSGPVKSNAGFMTQPIYIFATDVVGGDVQIQATGTYIILSAADGGPAASVDFVLPQVVSGTFNLSQQPADERYNGAQGTLVNYGAQAHVLKGFGTQPVNSSATGVVVPATSVVQWGGNGNQTAPWIATEADLCTAV